MEVKQLQRVFKYNDQELPDLNPDASPEDIKRMHAVNIPALATAAIEGPVRDGGRDVFTFNARIGTKG